jgi:hypothetical protein
MQSISWNENWQGKPKYQDKTYPYGPLSTTDAIWPNLGSKLGRRGEKLAVGKAHAREAHSYKYYRIGDESSLQHFT